MVTKKRVEYSVGSRLYHMTKPEAAHLNLRGNNVLKKDKKGKDTKLLSYLDQDVKVFEKLCGRCHLKHTGC